MPGVFTDPLFLPNIVNSVYKLVRPPVLAEAPPFTAATDCPTTPVESVDDRDDTVIPSPSPSTASTLTVEKGRVGLPTAPVQIIGDSGTESDKTEDLEPEEDSSYSAQVFPSTSDHALRNVDSRQVRWFKGLPRCCPFPQEGNNKEGEGGRQQ